MTEEILKAAAKEHGHECPGLALGLRVSEIASEVFGWEKIPEDLTVTADRPACYVDGIRFMTGCSPANGRISFRNDGKLLCLMDWTACSWGRLYPGRFCLH